MVFATVGGLRGALSLIMLQVRQDWAHGTVLHAQPSLLMNAIPNRAKHEKPFPSAPHTLSPPISPPVTVAGGHPGQGARERGGRHARGRAHRHHHRPGAGRRVRMCLRISDYGHRSEYHDTDLGRCACAKRLTSHILLFNERCHFHTHPPHKHTLPLRAHCRSAHRWCCGGRPLCC